MLRINGKVKYGLIAAVFCCLSACQTAESENTPSTPAAAGNYQPIHQQSVAVKETGAAEERVAAAPVKPVRHSSSVGTNSHSGQNQQLNRVIEPAKPQPKNRPAATGSGPLRGEPTVTYQAATILFADGSAVIAAEYLSEIRRIAATAKKNGARIAVYGFSSSRTRNTDAATHKMINFNASLKRAENVAAALIGAGVPKQAITVEALSDSQPLYQENMPEGERLNRRAEIYISY